MHEKTYAFELLRQLLRIKSPYFHEHEISEFVYEFMLKTGIEVTKQKVQEKNEFQYECNNIIGFLDAGKEKTILVNAHMDTVYPTEGWDYSVYDATLVEDKVYGLGAADMKGGLTSLLLFLEDAMGKVKNGESPNYNIIFLASVDEEGPYSLGARTFARSEWANNIDFCIVLESSNGISKNLSSFPTVLYGSKGCYLYEIKVTGKSAHAADPSAGENAINAMCKIVEKIDEIPLMKSDSFTEPISNVIWIDGGQRALSTPEKCEILVDFHITPEESHEELKEKIVKSLSSLNLGVAIEVEYMLDELALPMSYPPYLLDKNNRNIQRLVECCKETLNIGKVAMDTSICVGDFNHFNATGIPTVVLGPDGENLHYKNENVKLTDILGLKNILLNYSFK